MDIIALIEIDNAVGTMNIRRYTCCGNGESEDSTIILTLSIEASEIGCSTGPHVFSHEKVEDMIQQGLSFVQTKPRGPDQIIPPSRAILALDW